MIGPAILLQLVTLFVMACGGDAVTAPPPLPPPPPPAPGFASLVVGPAFSDLVTVAPANSVQLIVVALDQAREQLAIEGNAITYSSDAQGIATVSTDGLVTAVAPGNATITVTVTLLTITRTSSMTVIVHHFSGPAVTYDLTAVITTFDAGWGYDLAGYRYTAVLMFDQHADPIWLRGMYSDLWLIGPSGDSTRVADGGVIVGSRDGRVIIELLGDGNHIGLTLVVATLDSMLIDGQFGCCGHIGGTFRAERR